MTELEKLKAGLEYDMTVPEIDGLKLHAVKLCQKLNSIDATDYDSKLETIKELFGSVGKRPVVMPVFNCDNGKNIHVGDNFLANYNGRASFKSYGAAQTFRHCKTRYDWRQRDDFAGRHYRK